MNVQVANIEKHSPVYWHDETRQRLRIIEVRSSGLCLTVNREGDNKLVMIGDLKTIY
jgi:hypothetical protein